MAQFCQGLIIGQINDTALIEPEDKIGLTIPAPGFDGVCDA